MNKRYLVKEETKIPGTDIILESGDSFEVLEESTRIFDKYINPSLNNLFAHPTNWINKLTLLLNEIDLALHDAIEDKETIKKVKSKFILLLRENLKNEMRNPGLGTEIDTPASRGYGDNVQVYR
jgi:hypothetical protein